MSLKVLTPDQIEQFIEEGFVPLRNAFSPELAARCREVVWEKSGVSADDPAQWTKPVIHMEKSFKTEPFTEVMNDRIRGAFDDVMGTERWLEHGSYGWWPIAFPGFDAAPWKPPTTGWHVDGIHFHHHVSSAEQGLLPIFIFSDIAAGGGGTALSRGSHRITARVLADAEPAGLDAHKLARRLGPPAPDTVIESTGRAGDVMLIHPFVLHARSANTGHSVRFICNPCYSLREKMDLHRSNPAEYSPVEQAIVKAIS